MNVSSLSTPLTLPSTLETNAAATDSTPAKLKEIGADFESLFMSIMLKEMRNTISNEEGGGLFAGEGSDTLGGMFDTFLGQHLASSGQLGISQAIEGYLANRIRSESEEAPTTLDPHNPNSPAI